ncbi:flagellar export chaperone FliS [Desulfobacula toluolica]|uniref:FliS: prediucted flagellar protein S n=1 Tax=Desulfobacula toluolica (strain DSM 7467 / Tol2) TaxID=651182 RepID=K0NNS4_DESTT|nr:flagellar export chaperone FliS [Desulfobacula toluolica]CCK81703.1 FliS: prediucted flagellar protein S [Desulfobacula toluolica Tol2]
MAAYQQINTYLNNHYEGMDPEQLILLLFNGALSRLTLSREGIEEKNVQKKGENLSKAIAIISELNASVDSTMTDESTQFLRGIYKAILTELPNVTLNNDLKTLDRAQGYISRLKDIWETEVIAKQQVSPPEIAKNTVQKQAFSSAFNEDRPKKSFHAVCV